MVTTDVEARFGQLLLLFWPASASRSEVRFCPLLRLTGTCHAPWGATFAGVVRTIIPCVDPVNNTCFFRIVGRHLNFDLIAGYQSNETLPHFARNMSKDQMSVFQFNPEHGAG